MARGDEARNGCRVLVCRNTEFNRPVVELLPSPPRIRLRLPRCFSFVRAPAPASWHEKNFSFSRGFRILSTYTYTGEHMDLPEALTVAAMAYKSRRGPRAIAWTSNSSVDSPSSCRWRRYSQQQARLHDGAKERQGSRWMSLGMTAGRGWPRGIRRRTSSSCGGTLFLEPSVVGVVVNRRLSRLSSTTTTEAANRDLSRFTRS